MRKFAKHLFFIVFIAFYGLIIVIKITTNPTPFYDWDEAIYVQVGREMIENKSLIPIWQGKFWLDKPPLVMLIYGVIPKIFFFVAPEISTRILNLFLTLIYLTFIYIFMQRLTKKVSLSLFTVIITAFTPLFVQKAHTVNMDVFLGIGWLGYFLFYPRFFLSTIMLSFAVFSKSLLGFYPLFINFVYHLYLLLLNQIPISKLKKNIKKIIIQMILLSLWYLFMFYRFGFDFFYQHFYESHLKRVTSSIEFHFGERIFYIIEIAKQMKWFSPLALIGFSLMVIKLIKKEISPTIFFKYNLFLPWFLFLNLAKTKIYWYLYPSILQFSLYTGFFLQKILEIGHLRKYKKKISYILGLIIFFGGINSSNLLSIKYSNFDKFYQFSRFAKNKCNKIFFLPDENHRRAIEELEKMNLTITTTKWWGGHPSMVYYTENKIRFFYEKELFIKTAQNKSNDDCLGYFKSENLNLEDFKVKFIKKFDDLILIQ